MFDFKGIVLHEGSSCCAGHHGGDRDHDHEPSLIPFKKASLFRRESVFMGLCALYVLGLIASFFSFFSFHLQFFFFYAITLIALYPLLKSSYYTFKKRMFFTIETLVCVSCMGAIFIQEVKESSAIVLLFVLGEKLEDYMQRRSSSSIHLLFELIPEKITRLLKDGTSSLISTKDIFVGDLIELKPGERVPVDGLVYEGQSSFDESLLTGESLPVYKEVDSFVKAGTMNLEGRLVVKATAVGADHAVSRLIKLVEEAKSTKTNIMRFME
jgi:Cd2+/Zn2+-exporting ATPase